MHSSGTGSGCETDGTLTNIPVPNTYTRTWKFSKDSSYFFIYCDGRKVQVQKETEVGAVGAAGVAAAAIVQLVVEPILEQEAATVLIHLVGGLLVQDHPHKVEIVTANAVSV
ncbi:hypothetical protein ACHWQZ_G015557 [Mnemiopsis leidyi]